MANTDINEIQQINGFNYAALANLGQRFSRKGDSIIAGSFNIYDDFIKDKILLDQNYCFGTCTYDITNESEIGTITKISVYKTNSKSMDSSKYIGEIELISDITKVKDIITLKQFILFNLLSAILQSKDKTIETIYIPIYDNTTNKNKFTINTTRSETDESLIFSTNNNLCIKTNVALNNYFGDNESLQNDFWSNNYLLVVNSSLNLTRQFNGNLSYTYNYDDDSTKLNSITYTSVTYPYLNTNGKWVINGIETSFTGIGKDAGQPFFIIINDINNSTPSILYAPSEVHEKIKKEITYEPQKNISIQGINVNSNDIANGKITKINILKNSTTTSDSDILKNSILWVISSAKNVVIENNSDEDYKSKYGMETIVTMWGYDLENHKYIKIDDPYNSDLIINFNRICNVSGYVENAIKKFDFSTKTNELNYDHLNFIGVSTETKNNSEQYSDDNSNAEFFNFKILNKDEFSARYSVETSNLNNFNKHTLICEISDTTNTNYRGKYDGTKYFNNVPAIISYLYDNKIYDRGFGGNFPVFNLSEVIQENSTTLNRINILGIDGKPSSNTNDSKFVNGYLGIAPCADINISSANEIFFNSDNTVTKYSNIMYLGSSTINYNIGSATLQGKQSHASLREFVGFKLDFNNFYFGNDNNYIHQYVGTDESSLAFGIGGDYGIFCNHSIKRGYSYTLGKIWVNASELEINSDNISTNNSNVITTKTKILISECEKTPSINHITPLWTSYKIGENKIVYTTIVKPIGKIGNNEMFKDVTSTNNFKIKKYAINSLVLGNFIFGDETLAQAFAASFNNRYISISDYLNLDLIDDTIYASNPLSITWYKKINGDTITNTFKVSEMITTQIVRTLEKTPTNLNSNMEIN